MMKKLALCFYLINAVSFLAPVTASAVTLSAWTFNGPGTLDQTISLQTAEFSYEFFGNNFTRYGWAVEATVSGTGQIELDWEYDWDHGFLNPGRLLVTAPTLVELVGTTSFEQFGGAPAAGTTLLNVTDGTTVRLVFGGFNFFGPSLSGNLTLSYNEVAPVPLPPSAWMLGAAIIGITVRRRRQMRSL